ncbi:MAG: M14 family metallopeptidase [Oscillospiraceae bacterium]|nr:M14 family metallopeptidase [Oscillospiraceae bacterium]
MYHKIFISIDKTTYFTSKLAIELSHYIGFKSVAMEFPLFTSDRDLPDDILCFIINENMDDHFHVEAMNNLVTVGISASENSVRNAYEYLCDNFLQLSKNYQTGTHEGIAHHDFRIAENVPIEPFDKRQEKGLESLFDKDYILIDDNDDLLPDRLDSKILLPTEVSNAQLSALCSFAARFGMETTIARYPITTADTGEDNLFILRDSAECSLSLEEDDDGRHFVISGSGTDLVEFVATICEEFPLQKPGTRWLDILNELTDGLCMRTVDGQLAHIEHMKNEITTDTSCYFSPKINEVTAEILKDYSPAKFQGYKDLKKVHEKEYEIPWEVDVCKGVLDEKLWPHVKPGDKIELLAVLSEDKESRAKLNEEFAEIVKRKGAELLSSRVICAYKQGFSWLEEIIMPKLRCCKKIDEIEIFFKPFLAPGVTDWQDEDGAVPTYDNIKTDDEDKWFDLPIRYLQELYPIDDILSAELNIPRENIVFSEYKGNDDTTYKVVAKSDGEKLCEEKYKAYAHERNYIDAYPGMGKVHPGTGWIWVAINGKEVISERIETDVEHVWRIYQEDVLPYCHSFCQKKTEGRPTTADQPFFAQMRLDIQLSEPNEKLDTREDLLSSIDALHEDIYFVGLDFFKVYGNMTAGEIFDAPGLILPVIKKKYGKPYFKFTLYDQHGLEPAIDFGDYSIRPTLNRKDISTTIRKIQWINGKLSPVIKVEAPKSIAPILTSFTKLLSERKLSIEHKFKSISQLQFEVYEEMELKRLSVSISEALQPPKDLCIEDIDILEDVMIGYEEYIAIIEQLKRVSKIEVYISGESYLGRDIYAIEFLTEHKGYVSRTKLINQNPVLFVNARHHANEPSATNAAFMLIKELLTNSEFEHITQRLNIVVVPFENADGAAIHYELQKDNPTWILHTARFNAIGKEFYHEHFKDDTLHTEAMCLTRIWCGWLPDIIVDNHGVPTHEWAQQFSGYTSPSYKGFWLPRSLLYGCFWTVKEECYKDNLIVAKKIEEIVADVIHSDDKLVSINKDLTDRFAKYANRWMPRLFPAKYYRDMINVWMSFDFDPNHRYPSVRFPWITTVAYTSEITDETAQGDYLKMCARTHMLHDINIIRMLRDSKCVFEDSKIQTAEGISKSYYRQRPLIAP